MNVLAVVMAGGKGTRLRPLTCDKPKPMVPMANRPLLEHVLRLLSGAGWDRIAFTLCYLPEKIEAHFGDGARFGAEFHYFTEDQPLGTAGSVKMASRLFDGTFLVASGDALSDLDLARALAFHRERNAPVTIILARVESPLEYGVVMTDPEGRIVRFLEKPGWGEVFSDTVNTGFYLIEPEIMEMVPDGKSFDFSRDLFPLLLKQGKPLYGYIAAGYWSDIGTLEQYRRSHLDFLAGRVRLNAAGREIRPGVWAGRGVEIHPSAVLEGPVLIGDYCQIEEGAAIGPYTVIGDHCWLGRAASVKRSILWRHVYLGTGAEIRGAILGDHTVIRNGSAVYEGAVAGDGCLLGAHSVIRPRAKLWPGKIVESGSTVGEDLVWSERQAKGLFGAAGVTGVANVEITPELAVKLGAAFAATLGGRGEAAIASDGFPASRLLKRAATAGLLSAGLNVRDLGTGTVPILRYGIGLLGLAGGLHFGLSSRDPHQAVIQFLDARGLPIGRPAERAVEQSFATGDFPRAGTVRVGELSYAPGIAEMYLDGIKDLVDGQAVRSAGLKVLLGPSSGPAAFLLPGLMQRLGVSYVQSAAVEADGRQPAGPELTERMREGMAAELRASGADLAAVTDNAVEELFILDEQGRPIGQAQLATVLSLAELRRGSGSRLPVSVTATEAIADLARDFRGEIIRTKAQRRHLLEEFAAAAPSMRGLLLPAFDALVSLARLLELLATDGRDLGSIVASLPSYHRVEQAVACAWDAKGRLMRRLIEESGAGAAELTDGLRVETEPGWALILPDSEDPFIKVYTEARTSEEADALSKYFVGRIRALQNETTKTGVAD